MYTLPQGYPTEPFAALDHLKSHATLSIEDMQVLALIETYGEVFYEVMARGVDDAEAQALLLRNAAEERGHAHRLLKAIRLKGGSFELPDNAQNPFNPFGLDHVPASGEVLDLLQQAEVDGDLQYQTWADAEPNAEVAALLRLNGREETRHFERVAEVRKRLSIA